MVFEKIIFHFIFAAELAREAGDRIKPRVEAKPQPWVRHKYMVRAVKRAAEFGIKARKFEVYRPLRGLAQLGVAQPRVTPLRLHPGLYSIAHYVG
jgi:hypothetical protein